MLRGPLNRILHLLGISSSSSNWLIHDEFNDTDTSPINAPRTSVPGPGVLDFTELDGSFSIGSGVLDFAEQVSPVYGDLKFLSQSSFSRNTGRSLVTEIQIDSGDSAYLYFSNKTGDVTALEDIQDGLCFYFEIGGEIHVVLSNGTSLAESIGTWDYGVPYKISVTQLDEGAEYQIKGGDYTDWTLLFVYLEGTSDTLYPGFSNYLANGSLNYLRFWDADSSSFAPIFNVIPGEFTQSASGTSLTDGVFESWISPTNLTSWVESLSGLSTLNREDTLVHSGIYAARSDIDALNSQVSISQDLPAGSISDIFEVQGYVKSVPSGSSFSYNTNGDSFEHVITDTYTPYNDLLLTNSPSAALEVASESAASSSLYYDTLSARKITQNELQSSDADSIIDFEFILPDTPVSSALLRLENVNIFVLFYRFVMGLLKTLLK